LTPTFPVQSNSLDRQLAGLGLPVRVDPQKRHVSLVPLRLLLKQQLLVKDIRIWGLLASKFMALEIQTSFRCAPIQVPSSTALVAMTMDISCI
jgi:hypothetical protein